MKKHLITKQYTFLGYLMNLFWLLFLVLLLSIRLQSFYQVGNEILLSIGAATLLVILVIIVKSIINIIHIRRRQTEILEFAGSNQLNYDPGSPQKIVNFGLMSLAELKDVRDRKYRNFVTATDWEYCDFSYDIHRKTKSGSYKAATVYYGVMTTKLPRALPNVFFDSIRARKKQFRFHFSRSQRHSLEGDFDRYFVTYFPESYTIDSMSFISPDVMLALKAAADYDIEIVGDRVFLYGPLYEPESQITEMAAKLEALKKQLLDNILTYRDERLPFEEGRQRVSVKGAALKRSNFWKIVSLISIVFYILFRILLEVLPRILE